MADRSSAFKTIRLSIHPSASDRGQAVWALSISRTVRGVPHGAVLARGVLEDLPGSPTLAEMWEAVHDVAGCPWGPDAAE
jgi:hypothetical protein